MAAISGPAALIALATRLGIPNAAKLAFKKLQKLVTEALKKETKTKKAAQTGYRGQGPKGRQKGPIKERKIPTNLSINK